MHRGVAQLHPAGWIAWLSAVTAFAFAATNPLYTVLAIGAVLVVHVSFPPETSPVGRAVRVFLTLGALLLLARVVFVALLPNPGQTEVFTAPAFTTPRWVGGFELGGPVTAEVLVAGTSEGLRLILVLVAFGVFNARADLAALLRGVPAAFRDVGLVVSIAVAFVPGMMRTVGDVRDAQRLRGERGLRTVAPSLVVPVLGMSLERALLLAESMDVRGYGRGGSSRSSRTFLTLGLVAMLGSVVLWVAGRPRTAAAMAGIGAVALVWGFREASVASPATRLAGSPVRPFDLAMIAVAGVAIFVVALAGTEMGYDPYPKIVWPPFDWRVAWVTLLFALPSLGGSQRAGR